jgi:hypothetical protein
MASAALTRTVPLYRFFSSGISQTRCNTSVVKPSTPTAWRTRKQRTALVAQVHLYRHGQPSRGNDEQPGKKSEMPLPERFNKAD